MKWKVSKYQPLHAANLSNHIRKHVNLLTLQQCFNSKPRKAHERFTRFNPALILKKFMYRVKTRKWELLPFYQNWEIVALAVGDLEWSPKISQSFARSKSLAYGTCAMIDFLATFGGTLQKTGYSKCANETLARLHQCSSRSESLYWSETHMKLLFSPNNHISLGISNFLPTRQFSGGNSFCIKRELIDDDSFDYFCGTIDRQKCRLGTLTDYKPSTHHWQYLNFSRT